MLESRIEEEWKGREGKGVHALSAHGVSESKLAAAVVQVSAIRREVKEPIMALRLRFGCENILWEIDIEVGGFEQFNVRASGDICWNDS